MQSIDLIRRNLASSATLTLARVEDMRELCLVPPTPNAGGHTLWLLGHLAFIEGLVIHQFALGRPNPLAQWEEAFDGEAVSFDARKYPPFDEVLRQCRESRRDTLAILEALTEDDLDRPSPGAPKGFDETFGTLRLCFQFVADHWLMHRGQLADSRRAAGVGRMWL